LSFSVNAITAPISLLKHFELSHFDTYFHVLLELNLGYAGIETFRSIIDEKVFELTKNLGSKYRVRLKSIKDKLTVISAEATEDEKVIIRIKDVEKNMKRWEVNKRKAIKADMDFTTGFKSMFVFSFLYCICILLIAGYQQVLSEATMENALLIMHSAFIYNLVIFIRSFTKKSHRRVSILWPVSVILAIMLITWLYINFCPISIGCAGKLKIEASVAISMFISASPYLLHVLKAFITKTKMASHQESDLVNIEKELNDIDGYMNVQYSESFAPKGNIKTQVVPDVTKGIRNE
jgi:hypothetical protein